MTRKDLMSKIETAESISKDKDLQYCDWVPMDAVNEYLDTLKKEIQRINYSTEDLLVNMEDKL